VIVDALEPFMVLLPEAGSFLSARFARLVRIAIATDGEARAASRGGGGGH
jgi:hypothetical protein